MFADYFNGTMIGSCSETSTFAMIGAHTFSYDWFLENYVVRIRRRICYGRVI